MKKLNIILDIDDVVADWIPTFCKKYNCPLPDKWESPDITDERLNELRKNGVKVNFDYNAKSFGAQMKKANKENAEYVLILGEEEQNENVVTMKRFSTGEQEKYSVEEVLKILAK